MKRVVLLLCAVMMLLSGCALVSRRFPTAPAAPAQTEAVEAKKELYSEEEKEELRRIIKEEMLKGRQVKIGFAKDASECTDVNQLYVLSDGYLYQAVDVSEKLKTYTNLLPQAVKANGQPYEGDLGEAGYRTDYRIKSSLEEVEATGMCCTGFVPISGAGTIRIKNVTVQGSVGGYILFYSANLQNAMGVWEPAHVMTDPVNGVYTLPAPPEGAAFMRLSLGNIDKSTIITVNEEIVEPEQTHEWVNTGVAFLAPEFDELMTELTVEVAENSAVLDKVKEILPGTDTLSVEEQIQRIKTWNAPIYDTAPVFLLSEKKPAVGADENTVQALYAKYDSLMEAYPGYITRTDLGMASDGVTPIYRYDFCEPAPHKNLDVKEHPEPVKAKAILVSGIHLEWAGIHALYNALEEITVNPDLYQSLRKNTHLIVIPAANPYCLDESRSAVTDGRKNANGVEIHRNFEVDHAVIDRSSNNYGGAKPLSEPESQYIDKVMRENTDAAFFMTCHNYDTDTYYGTGVLWTSAATHYMYNMGCRLSDKMSAAWMEAYGDTFRTGVDRVRTDLQSQGDYSVGMVGLSATPGTETKQALKYGIQGTNLEISKVFSVFESQIMGTETMTHGTEVYINFLLMAFDAYDHSDKLFYAN